MNKTVTLVAAALFALSGTAALAADAPAKAAGDAAKAAAKMEKPASITQAAWDKMSDAEKKNAVEKAKMAAPAAAKKPKKGGC